MSDISRIFLNEATDDLIIEILKLVLPVLEKRRIDYFIVGAFARDLGLQAMGFDQELPRKTNDIDLAVMVGSSQDYEDLMQALVELPDFELDKDEPFRIRFNGEYEVDILPFGKIADEKGQVILKAKKTIVLDIPGFQEIEPWVKTVYTKEGMGLRVSSLAGVVLLKLLAWEDRPNREKDITDIDYILKNYYLLFVEEIIKDDSDLLDLYGQEEYFSEAVSAHFIGREINRILRNSPKLYERVLDLLGRQKEGFDMARLMGFRNLEIGQRIIACMELGLGKEKNESRSD